MDNNTLTRRSSDMDLVDEMADVFPSERWRHALAWWWVAELVRRHPYLVVWEQVSKHGHQDSLVIAKPVEGRLERRLEIDRNGNIHFPGRQIPMIDGPWGQLFDAEDPHALIHKMESAGGLGHPGATPAAEPQSLALRLIASVLMAKIHDKDSWSCRMVGPTGDVRPLSEKRLEESFSPLHREPQTEPTAPGREWVVFSGTEPVALVDLEGYIQLAGKSTSVAIMNAYDAHDRRLIPTMADVLGPVL
jgi:hypothetical protein